MKLRYELKEELEKKNEEGGEKVKEQ